MRQLTSKVVDLNDSRLFAEFSGDFNPLHVNPVAARRTMFGECVVHGVHALLVALDAWAAGLEAPKRIVRCVARFQAPIMVGAEFAVVQQPATDEAAARLSVILDGRTAHIIDITLAPLLEDGSLLPVPDRPAFDASAPRNISFAEAAASSGSIECALDTTELRRRFPSLAALNLDGFVASVLAATRVVGMECPGLNSVFSSLDYTADESVASDAGFSYRATASDERLSRLKIALAGAGGRSEITALYRPAPVKQDSFASVRRQVRQGVFSDQSAVVIGGSRGIGEATSKMLAAGGAKVWLTYLSGKDDAEAIAREIKDGGGIAAAGYLDIASGAFSAPQFAGGFKPSHIYVCASPPIRGKRGTEWDQDLFLRYFAAYGTGAISAVRRLASDMAAELNTLTVFIPSSVFVDEPPVALAEYAAAKAAAEVAWRAFAKAHPGMKVSIARLSKMRTDQTNSLVGASGAAASDVLLPYLLELGGPSHEFTARHVSAEKIAS
jgi:NAD(P)-dependent dehydrogenase (short-subunit alcohol dehydrogenase family)